jgi:alpha-L-arabinofuranosidase
VITYDFIVRENGLNYRKMPSTLREPVRNGCAPWLCWIICVVFAFPAVLPTPLPAANVIVNVSNTLATVSQTAYGMHTSVYDNQHGNAALPARISQSGVNTLRYPGGGYADIFHWSVARSSSAIVGNGLSPWWGEPGNYGYVGPQTDFGNFVRLLDSISNGLAVITVNYGSALKLEGNESVVPDFGGQAREAAAWVAYANAEASLYGTTNDITIGVDQQGNDWKTAGYWARLRASTSGEYQIWATADGVYNADNSFLAINHDAPVGIQYWEIGNETFGTGYYGGGDGYSVSYAVPYDSTSRTGHPNLSPAYYGQKVNEYAQAMRAVDPTIRIGAVLSTPPDDYSWDVFNGQHWNPQVLQRCATNIDFVMAHWYPDVGSNANGSNLLAFIRTKLRPMIDGSTTNQDFNANAGLRDWIKIYRPSDSTNVEIFITEFHHFGTVASTNRGAAEGLFAADSYATWMDLGVANIDYLEMNKQPFLGDSASLTRGSAYYSIQLLNKMARPGDRLVATTSDNILLRTHAARKQDGSLGLALINTSLISNQTVNVTITNIALNTSGVRYQFGNTNFTGTSENPNSPPSTNAVSGLGNSFNVTVPVFTMMVLIIPPASNTPPVFEAITDRTNNVGQPVSFIAVATDTNTPPQTLTFTLLDGPINATFHTNSGQFQWRPIVSQADTTNVVVLKVTDNGTPSLSATQTFSVIVRPLPVPQLASSINASGEIILALDAIEGPDYGIQASTNLLDWEILFITNAPPSPIIWTNTITGENSMRFFRAVIGPLLP